MSKHQEDIQKVKGDLMKKYEEHLDEIFANGTYDLTFDQREKLISKKLEKETTEIMERHIEKDPKGVSKEPAETWLCMCQTEAVLCRDPEGNPVIYERHIQTKSGPVLVKEYGYYCTKDRKIFFPSQKDTSAL